jgi:coenzyme PQQ precursor peptide PqqA
MESQLAVWETPEFDEIGVAPEVTMYIAQMDDCQDRGAASHHRWSGALPGLLTNGRARRGARRGRMR